MEKRHIGKLEVSVIGLGCNNFGKRVDEAGSVAVIDAAIASGINFFDTADIYGDTLSEQFLGRALGPRRKQIILATKFGMPVDPQRRGAKPAYVMQAVEASLKRLGTDYIDLYQLHQPDPETPVADTLHALDELVRAGKIREIGCSNFSAAQLDEAAVVMRAGAARFVSVQNEYSLLHREPEAGVLAACRRNGLAFIPYFPLASGLLTGKYRRGTPAPATSRFGPAGWARALYTDRNLAIIEDLSRYAEELGFSMLQLAFSWLLSRPPVASVIAGATTADQVRGNALAYPRRLTEAELAALDEILARQPQ